MKIKAKCQKVVDRKSQRVELTSVRGEGDEDNVEADIVLFLHNAADWGQFKVGKTYTVEA